MAARKVIPFSLKFHASFPKQRFSPLRRSKAAAAAHVSSPEIKAAMAFQRRFGHPKSRLGPVWMVLFRSPLPTSDMVPHRSARSWKDLSLFAARGAFGRSKLSTEGGGTGPGENRPSLPWQKRSIESKPEPEPSSAPPTEEKHVACDPAKVQAAFIKALAWIAGKKRLTTSKAVARLAYAIYIEDFPEGDLPKLHTFLGWVGPNKKRNSKIGKIVNQLLEISPYVKQRGAPDLAKIETSFKKALARIEEEEAAMSPRAVAMLAHAIYIEDFPKEKRLEPKTFIQWVCTARGKGGEIGKIVNPLLEASPHVKQQVSLDSAKVEAAFSEALRQIAEKREQVSPHSVAKLAHQIYIKIFPEGDLPRENTFLGWVSTKKGKNSEIGTKVNQMLEQSRYVKKQR